MISFLGDLNLQKMHSMFSLPDLQELLLLANKDTSVEDVAMLTPPGSDFNSDSDSSPGSPSYDEMGKKLYELVNSSLIPATLPVTCTAHSFVFRFGIYLLKFGNILLGVTVLHFAGYMQVFKNV